MTEETYRGSQQRSLVDVETHLHAQLRAQQALIAELREANEHLVVATVSAQDLRDEAEAANRRQNEFLAMLAHELRNPLSPISMAAAMLERVPDASPQLSNLRQVISRQVSHMAHLLDDLLDAARISSGKITLSPQPLLLGEIIEQALETVQSQVRERNQQLTISLPAEHIVVDADRVRLTQVFSNLLSNASKYTGDGGSIDLRVEAGDREITVVISDNGTGITAEVLPHIFDLFTQGPRSLARSEGGLGVGLNIVRNLVGMHGGRVSAHSDGAGLGTSFYITLPRSRKEAVRNVEAAQPAAMAAARRVLLIEDNIDACETLRDFLLTEGHAVSIAYDGHAGLQAALADHFDVVVCDIGLPGMDGFDLVRHLRAADSLGNKPLTVALSGYCQAEVRDRAFEAGFDHFFIKPLRPEELLALLEHDAAHRSTSAGYR